MRRKSPDEINEFCREVLANRILTSHQVPEDLIGSVFLMLKLGAFHDWELADIEQVGVLYERLDQAGPVAVNGWPSFLSLQVMHRDDWALAFDKLQKMEAAMEAALGE